MFFFFFFYNYTSYFCVFCTSQILNANEYCHVNTDNKRKKTYVNPVERVVYTYMNGIVQFDFIEYFFKVKYVVYYKTVLNNWSKGDFYNRKCAFPSWFFTCNSGNYAHSHVRWIRTYTMFAKYSPSSYKFLSKYSRVPSRSSAFSDVRLVFKGGFGGLSTCLRKTMLLSGTIRLILFGLSIPLIQNVTRVYHPLSPYVKWHLCVALGCQISEYGFEWYGWELL